MSAQGVALLLALIGFALFTIAKLRPRLPDDEAPLGERLLPATRRLRTAMRAASKLSAEERDALRDHLDALDEDLEA